jgi:hypothetical protein
MTLLTLDSLLHEYEAAIAYTAALYTDLTDAELHWRSGPNASAIGWHLGHQAAVAHFMVRNLTAAEPSIDPALDALMDSATPESQRGDLPSRQEIERFRSVASERLRVRIGAINSGHVGAPTQLRRIARSLLVAVINHEYQHSKWIGELRSEQFGKALPSLPSSSRLVAVDGYLVIDVGGEA